MIFPNQLIKIMKPVNIKPITIKANQATKSPGKNLYMKSTVSVSIGENINPLLTESQLYAV